jgi:hypothetical protein
LHSILLRNIAVLNSSPLTILRSLRERSENRKRIGVAEDAGIEPRPLRTIRHPLCLPSRQRQAELEFAENCPQVV